MKSEYGKAFPENKQRCGVKLNTPLKWGLNTPVKLKENSNVNGIISTLYIVHGLFDSLQFMVKLMQ